MRYSNQDLIQILKRVSDELGRIPYRVDLKNPNLVNRIIKQFGSWENALIEAGLLTKSEIDNLLEFSSSVSEEMMVGVTLLSFFEDETDRVYDLSNQADLRAFISDYSRRFQELTGVKPRRIPINLTTEQMEHLARSARDFIIANWHLVPRSWRRILISGYDDSLEFDPRERKLVELIKECIRGSAKDPQLFSEIKHHWRHYFRMDVINLEQDLGRAYQNLVWAQIAQLVHPSSILRSLETSSKNRIEELISKIRELKQVEQRAYRLDWSSPKLLKLLAQLSLMGLIDPQEVEASIPKRKLTIERLHRKIELPAERLLDEFRFYLESLSREYVCPLGIDPRCINYPKHDYDSPEYAPYVTRFGLEWRFFPYYSRLRCPVIWVRNLDGVYEEIRCGDRTETLLYTKWFFVDRGIQFFRELRYYYSKYLCDVGIFKKIYQRRIDVPLRLESMGVGNSLVARIGFPVEKPVMRLEQIDWIVRELDQRKLAFEAKL